MLKNINWSTVLSSLIVTIVTVGIQLVANFITSDNGLIRIGDTIKMGESSYQVGIEIKNFSEKAIENIGIEVPTALKLEDINANMNLNISLAETNVGQIQSEAIIIDRIPENQSVQIIISTDKSIDSKEIVVRKNGNNIKVMRLDEEKSEFRKSITTTIIYGVLLLFIYGGAGVILDAKQKERVDELKKETEELQKKSDDMKKEANIEIEKMKLEYEKIRKRQTKMRVLLEAKLRDYRLELDFWKDTIRKILYKSTNNKISSEELINTVTETLKTYQTRTKNSLDLDAIALLAQAVKSEENSNI